ncbi:MAG: DNA polymerase III subunit epsilon [Actinomycetaceae bacterium]|nr:DNA polymerase III subunit epsilon [Actinomycetaceae bacterium]
MWTTNPILGFDTETTGIDPAADRLVTCSVIVVDGEKVTKHYWLADPGVEIPLQAQNVHGISTEQARREGRPIREVLEEVAQLLADHMALGYPVVAFNASYDLTLIESELARHGLPTLEERLEREIGPVVDPYMLDRSVDRYRRGQRRLENLAQHYGVAQEDAFHNAEADVLATLRVLGAMLRRFPELAEESWDALMERQSRAYAEFINFIASRNRAKGKSFNEPIGWPVAKATH